MWYGRKFLNGFCKELQKLALLENNHLVVTCLVINSTINIYGLSIHNTTYLLLIGLRTCWQTIISEMFHQIWRSKHFKKTYGFYLSQAWLCTPRLSRGIKLTISKATHVVKESYVATHISPKNYVVDEYISSCVSVSSITYFLCLGNLVHLQQSRGTQLET